MKKVSVWSEILVRINSFREASHTMGTMEEGLLFVFQIDHG